METRIRLNDIFRRWHRAKLLGLVLDKVEIDGVPLTAREVERLNYWIGADGAFRCSRLSYWECWSVLDKAMGRKLDIACGPSCGGRWPSGTMTTSLFC